MSNRQPTLHERYTSNPDGCTTFGEYVIRHYAKAECVAEYRLDGKWHKTGDFDGCSVGYVVGIFDEVAKDGRMLFASRVRLVEHDGIVVKTYGAS